jgi:HD-GYP domain-containing protein (c-di-GMP phosphodiesterase class II)
LWIDTAKGSDVSGGVDLRQVNREVERALETAVAQPGDQDLLEPTSVALEKATAIVRRAVPKVAAMFGEARLGRAVQAADCESLVDEISESVRRNPGALISVARLKQRDTYTYMHSVAVCALMLSLGRRLGLRGDTLKAAGLAGMLHDLGKVAVPLEVLNKPGKLTQAEFEQMKTHPERGHELLVKGRAGAEALDVCLHHHEKIDGSGYPHGLQGDGISLLAKMGAVCDVYDAITSVRPYKEGWDPGEALRSMAQWTGHFEPLVFQAFVKTVGIYPVGSLVRLRSGRLAVVTAQNPAALLTPKVKVFYSTKSEMRIDPFEIDLAARQCQDHMVGCESPDHWNFKDLEQLARAT